MKKIQKEIKKNNTEKNTQLRPQHAPHREAYINFYDTQLYKYVTLSLSLYLVPCLKIAEIIQFKLDVHDFRAILR